MTHLLTQLRTEHMSHSMTWASEEQSYRTLEGASDATERRPRTWQPQLLPPLPWQMQRRKPASQLPSRGCFHLNRMTVACPQVGRVWAPPRAQGFQAQLACVAG